jgi:PKD repeat protein
MILRLPQHLPSLQPLETLGRREYMFPSTWRRWIRKAAELDRAEQIQRQRQCLPRIEALELRLVPAFTATSPVPLSVTEGVATGVTVATFTTDTPTDNFAATIVWGDGTTDVGTVSPGGGNSFSVTGSHTYADEGSYTTSISLTETGTSPDFATVTGSATVADADALTGTGLSVFATEGSSFSGAVGTFTNTGFPDNAAADFTATIDWGDGTTDTGAAVTVSGGSGSDLTVSGSHTYADEGTFTTNITLTDDAPGTASATATGVASVAEADLLFGGGFIISPTEGSSFSGQVASFIDIGNPGNSASDFTATIDWGDGTTDAGTVSGTSGFFTVSGTHTYADEGTFTTTTTLTDDSPGTASATASGLAFVAEGDVLNGSGLPVTATEGSQFNGAVATFTNTGYPDNPASDFTATIDWGDGTTDAGTVSGSSGLFTVSGSHTYADEGSFTTTVTLTDDVPGTASATATGTANVAEGDFGSLLPAFINATEGVQFSGAVGSFTDEGNPSQVASDFTATIDWGDGTTTPGTVSGSTGGPFTISGTHTYADEGTFTITATFSDDPPSALTDIPIFSTANVAEADVLAGSGLPVFATEGSSFSGAVATFIDTGFPDNTAGDFTATIDWGDGTTDAGTVSGASGFFTVSGSHTYADEGSFTTTVTLADDAPGTASATATGIATVSEGDFGTLRPATINATEGSEFSGAVASFTDEGNPSQVASDFTATIDWGDGTTTPGTVSGSTGGPFTISGSHTYADEGTFTVTATFSDDPPSTLTDISIISTANVAEGDGLVGTGLTITPTEGNAFSGAVATFSNTGFPDNAAADFTATIDWGDGTTDTGAAVTVTGGSSSDLTVSGSHTYAEDGSYNAVVTLSDDDPGTATATANSVVNVEEGFFELSAGNSISATEGQSFSGTLATFSDPGSPDPASDFTATIDWGDGTTESGTVSGSAGSFTVTGTHTYADEIASGIYLVTVTEIDANFTIGPVGNFVNVSEADVLSPVSVTTGNVIENELLGGQAAVFGDSNTSAVASDFTATMDWGDGTTTTCTVTGGDGLFTVSTPAHAYADEGVYTVRVTLIDDAPGTASLTQVGTLTAGEADTLVGTGMTISAIEASGFTGAVATFSDTGFPDNNPADFTATIDWGDGTITPGTVTGGSGSDFTVSGSHTYAEDGSYTTSATLTDDAPGTASATATGVANVGEFSLAITGASIHSTEGVQFSGTVATARDPGSPDPASDFGATIDWGDGTTTPGTVSGSAGNYTISGNHTYSDEGSFTASVTFFENNDPTFTASQNDPVTVDEADVLAGTGLPVTGTEGSTFTGAVATFTDTGFPGNTAGDFTATIDWGDGTTTTGTVSGGSGLFTVSGSHTYADEGSFATTVILTDDAPGTASATATGTASVAEADILSGTGLSVTSTEGSTFSGAVATFTNTGYPGNLASDFTATIDWGDGTTTAGTVSGSSGFFTVSGTHSYTDEGSFTTTVTLTDDAPGTASATATGVANVAEGDVLIGTGLTITPTEGSTFTGAVATFIDTGYPGNSPSDFTATIDWGDGTTTTGTVSGANGLFTVSGSHAYADEGTLITTVILTDDAPGTASTTARGLVTVAEGDVLSPTGIFFTGTEGFLFSGTIASFSHTGYPSNPASDFTATIDWGDGTTTAGTVTASVDILNVSGSHLYTTSAHFNVKVTLSDDAPGTASATASSTATIQEQLLAAGTGAGQQPLVHIYDAVSGNLLFTFDAFAPAFLGGVRVAVGDVNGDGVPDIIVAAGPGGGPHVKVIDGTKLSQVDANGEIEDSALLGQFYAYSPFFNGGVYVAFGISEGTPEIVTGAGPGGSPHVKVIDATKLSQLQSDSVIADSALVAQFYAYSPFFNGGVRVAAADLNGDQVLDIVTGAGPGGGPHVKAIDGDRLDELDNNAEISESALIGQFYAYTTTTTPSGGVFVAATDIGGNPVIITGDGSQADGAVDGPLVKVIDATKLNVLDSNSEPTGAALLGKFFAYDPAFQGGVTVGAAEINGDTAAEIITGAGPGGGPHVKVIDGNQLDNLQPNMEIADAAVLDSFYAFQATFTGGVFIGAGT